MKVTKLTIKAATRRLVKACGGQESCALIDGINDRHQHFSEVGLVSEKFESKFLRLDHVALLEADCGEPEVTRELARATGHKLVKLPRAMAAEAPVPALLSIAKESTEVVATGWDALADGKITASERAVLRKQIADALEALLELDARLEADEEAGNG